MSFELFAEITRNNIVESRHFGAAVITDSDGQILHQWGDGEQMVFPRSALKPFYAIALIASGAAKHYNLTDKELAMACASHSGEAMHSELVAAWLTRLGLKPDDLACGETLPDDPKTAQDLLTKGQGVCRIHHNCSGKHASFLTICLHLNYELNGYHLAAHPVQQNSFDILSDLANMDMRQFSIGIDGCGFPAPTMPLAKLAHLAASFAAPKNLSSQRQDAVHRIHLAMKNQPFYVAGHGNVVSDVMHVTKGKVLVKSGAEGIMTAAIPSLGLGIAIKIADGSARTRGAVLLAILRQLDILLSNEIGLLQNHINPVILNSRHDSVGEIRSTIQPFKKQIT